MRGCSHYVGVDYIYDIYSIESMVSCQMLYLDEASHVVAGLSSVEKAENRTLCSALRS